MRARELLQILEWTAAIRRAHPEERLAGTVTQFVVGAAGETDRELLGLSILQARRQVRLTDLAQLQRLGIRTAAQAASYILRDGRRPTAQLRMF